MSNPQILTIIATKHPSSGEHIVVFDDDLAVAHRAAMIEHLVELGHEFEHALDEHVGRHVVLKAGPWAKPAAD